MPSPQTTWFILLTIQFLHLLHHRLAKKHVSFVEVISGGVLLVPPDAPLPAVLLVGAHLVLSLIQIAGSIWIDRLSPDWSRSAASPAAR